MVFRGGGNKFLHGFTKVFRKTTRGVNKALDNPFVDTTINMAPMLAMAAGPQAAVALPVATGVVLANQFRKVANAGRLSRARRIIRRGGNIGSILGKINSVNPMRRPVEAVMRRTRRLGGKLNKKQQALLAAGIGTLVGAAAAYAGRRSLPKQSILPQTGRQYTTSSNIAAMKDPLAYQKYREQMRSLNSK